MSPELRDWLKVHHETFRWLRSRSPEEIQALRPQLDVVFRVLEEEQIWAAVMLSIVKLKMLTLPEADDEQEGPTSPDRSRIAPPVDRPLSKEGSRRDE